MAAASSPIDLFWAGFFGCAMRPGVQIVPHAALAGYRGVWFFVRESCCVVSAPPGWCEPLASALAEATIDSVMSPPGLDAVFGDAFASTIGPSWLGWLRPECFKEAGSDRVRAADAQDLERLREARPADWEAAGLEPSGAVGWFEDGEIFAAASMRAWAPGVFGPGVLSRRPGCGAAVVSAVVTRALENGDLVIYQTLMENERAVGIARRLGFSYCASHLAVRLTRDAP